MIKKAIGLMAITAFMMTVSCKKEGVGTTAENAGVATMEFTETEHDFGEINEGDKVENYFTFKNTGVKDLVIVKATGSCGCTVPEYPKTPVKPGEEGKIKVSFNSAGKEGMQHKTVTITANTKKANEVITIKATVKEKQGIGA